MAQVLRTIKRPHIVNINEYFVKTECGMSYVTRIIMSSLLANLHILIYMYKNGGKYGLEIRLHKELLFPPVLIYINSDKSVRYPDSENTPPGSP